MYFELERLINDPQNRLMGHFGHPQQCGEFVEDYRVQVLLAACQKLAHGEAITLLFADDSGTTRCINKQSTGKIKEYNLNKSKIFIKLVKN